MASQRMLTSGNSRLVFQPEQDLLREAVLKSESSGIFVLVDENTEKHCLPYFMEQLGKPKGITVVKMNAGEINKTEKNWLSVLAQLHDAMADRHALLVNLGGGVVTDLGGFAAAVFKRGIKYINVPTSLLAMVDASTGAKTGIDFRYTKNELGVFYEPEYVFIDSTYLKTLPERHFTAALAEMLKHSLLNSEDALKAFLDTDFKNGKLLDALIFKSVQFKSLIVQQDFHESGLRKQLNFGHTFGHAFESYYLNTDKPLFHGEAVAVGLICALYLSQSCVHFQKDLMSRITGWIKDRYLLPIPDESEFEAIFSLMKHDKKNSGGSVLAVLLSSPGHPWHDKKINKKQAFEALDYYSKVVKGWL